MRPVILKGWPVLFAEWVVSGGMKTMQRGEWNNTSTKETDKKNHEPHKWGWLSDGNEWVFYFQVFKKFRCGSSINFQALGCAIIPQRVSDDRSRNVGAWGEESGCCVALIYILVGLLGSRGMLPSLAGTTGPSDNDRSSSPQQPTVSCRPVWRDQRRLLQMKDCCLWKVNVTTAVEQIPGICCPISLPNGHLPAPPS